MRYFVYAESDEDGISPYILAEVVASPAEAPELSAAAALAGARTQILSRDELLLEPEGRAALDAWDARDDTWFDRETAALDGGTSERPSHLTDAAALVARPGRRPMRFPRDEGHRAILIQAQGLRAVTRQLAQAARDRRLAIDAARERRRDAAHGG